MMKSIRKKWRERRNFWGTDARNDVAGIGTAEFAANASQLAT
jgi:hypothetical protein